MKLFKSFVLVFSLVLSSGFISTTAFAAGPPTAESGLKAIDTVLGHISEALNAIDANESKEVVREHIMQSLRSSKEVTGTELLEKNRLKFSRILKKARTAVKKDDAPQAKEFLLEAKERFGKLKTLL